MLLHKIKLPQHLRRFPSDLNVVGGEARVAAWCLIHQEDWPNTYVPRDFDYTRIASEEEANGDVGILWNETAKTREGKHIDCMVVSSLEDHFAEVDQHTNAVTVVNNHYLAITEEAISCYLSKRTKLNLEHPRLSKDGVSFWEYLALRACIQTGWDIRYCKQYYRHAACKLHASIYKQLDYSSLKYHWYFKAYCFKMEQVKSGKH